MNTKHTPDDLTFGLWPDGSYVTFHESAKTEQGTIEWKAVIGVYGSAEEARTAIQKARGQS